MRYDLEFHVKGIVRKYLSELNDEITRTIALSHEICPYRTECDEVACKLLLVVADELDRHATDLRDLYKMAEKKKKKKRKRETMV